MRYHIPHLHMPGHGFVLRVEHLFRDKRFWAMVGITVLVAGLLALVIWAGQGERGNTENFPLNPTYPHFP